MGKKESSNKSRRKINKPLELQSFDLRPSQLQILGNFKNWWVKVLVFGGEKGGLVGQGWINIGEMMRTFDLHGDIRMAWGKEPQRD
jgi:hypothetical protein